MKDVEGWVVGEDEHVEILATPVGQLMGLAWGVDPDVPRRDVVGLAADADAAVPGADEEEFPLGEVQVEWADCRAGRDATLLDVEGVAAALRSDVADPAQRKGEIPAEGMEPSGGRTLLAPGQGGPVDAVHRRYDGLSQGDSRALGECAGAFQTPAATGGRESP